MVVIGYELVSYLLHYTSTRCVTFKELFVCKSNNKNGKHEICTLIFSSSTRFFLNSFYPSGHHRPKQVLNECFPTYA